MAHAGFDAVAALGAAAQFGQRAWAFATPISDWKIPIEDSRFYKSIKSDVDDPDKIAEFGLLMTMISRATTVSNFMPVLHNFSVQAKVAHTFDAFGSSRKLMELKHNNKDRIYYYQMHIQEKPTLVFLLAEHKKDRTTPKPVKSYSEFTIKGLLDPKYPPTFVH